MALRLKVDSTFGQQDVNWDALWRIYKTSWHCCWANR